MGVVGEFPLGKMNRATRMPANPFDKATIVSIYPWDITEVKATIQPGKFHIPKGSYEQPSILVVGPSSWWRDVDEGDNVIEIPTGSILIASAIIEDYCRGTIECNMIDAKPGLFYLPGELSTFKVKNEHKAMLQQAKASQDRWYERLIRVGDSLWARSGGNPLAIDDRMRVAAKELQRDKPWLADFQLIELVPCVACGTLRNPNFPICHSCNRVIDAEKAKAMGISA